MCGSGGGAEPQPGPVGQPGHPLGPKHRRQRPQQVRHPAGGRQSLELVGFAQHPSPPTLWGSLLFAARSTLSIADPEARLTGWGKLLQLSLRLAGPVLLGLALLSVRNRVKR